MTMKGFFQLLTAADLRSKLHYEYEKLQKDPGNPYEAFNFFVTAEHLLDWRYPADLQARTAARKSQPLLQVVSHLANGAKHFETDTTRHKSVSHTGRTGGFFGSRFFGARFFGSSYFSKGSLVVKLDGEAATTLGGSITALELAKRVLNYWDGESLPR